MLFCMQLIKERATQLNLLLKLTKQLLVKKKGCVHFVQAETQAPLSLMTSFIIIMSIHSQSLQQFHEINE